MANRWRIVLGVAAVGLLAAGGAIAEQAAKPNVLFIFSDDHAVRTIGAYNPEFDGTPNIDRLAESGAVFTRSYCENSICQPSRAAGRVA